MSARCAPRVRPVHRGWRCVLVSRGAALPMPQWCADGEGEGAGPAAHRCGFARWRRWGTSVPLLGVGSGRWPGRQLWATTRIVWTREEDRLTHIVRWKWTGFYQLKANSVVDLFAQYYSIKTVDSRLSNCMCQHTVSSHRCENM